MRTDRLVHFLILFSTIFGVACAREADETAALQALLAGGAATVGEPAGDALLTDAILLPEQDQRIVAHLTGAGREVRFIDIGQASAPDILIVESAEAGRPLWLANLPEGELSALQVYKALGGARSTLALEEDHARQQAAGRAGATGLSIPPFSETDIASSCDPVQFWIAALTAAVDQNMTYDGMYAGDFDTERTVDFNNSNRNLIMGCAPEHPGMLIGIPIGYYEVSPVSGKEKLLYWTLDLGFIKLLPTISDGMQTTLVHLNPDPALIYRARVEFPAAPGWLYCVENANPIDLPWCTAEESLDPFYEASYAAFAHRTP
jgi:hypothetical protein